MKLRKLTILALALSLGLLPLRGATQHEHDHTGHEQHSEVSEEEHDHATPPHEPVHEGHDDGHEHAHDDGELVVELTPEAVSLAEIKTAVVQHGAIVRRIELPGEVGFNEDRLAHIAPRFAGIALQAMKRVGDRVEAGEAVAVVESNESMNPYTIESPITGWVIQRHITPGEFVSEQRSIYVIVDLSDVWVDLAVYPKDAHRIREGQVARIRALGTDLTTEGVIDYVTPVMDVHTRSLTARVVLPNTDNRWRPGFFVQATVAAEAKDEGLVVEKEAVQYLDEQTVVFLVEGAGHYRPVGIITGASDQEHVRVLSGLQEGQKYVSKGAFELKARIVTGALGGHAGHGH
jgi:cobalt-zinc-cadmium efflux system membrane fusion protein